MKRQFKCRVVDKEKKNGWLWDSYNITLRLLETGTVISQNVPAEQYYDVTVGWEGFVTLYKHSNNLWYSSAE